MTHWFNVRDKFWDLLEKHIDDYLAYMVVFFDDGCEVQLDYLAHSHQQIVTDIHKSQDNGWVLIDSCLINDSDMRDSFISLNALFEGYHYDDKVKFIKLIFSSNDRDFHYVFNGDQWSNFEHKYEDRLYAFRSYYNNGIISEKELKDLAILDPKNSTLFGD